MKETIFVIGGCRSGKSRYALSLAQNLTAGKKIFIATCIPHDDEMKRRVSLHQDERGTEWETVEAPVNLPEAIVDCSREADVLLVDCLTLWINNLFGETIEEEKIYGHIEELTKAVEAAACSVILVSNEVGMGIVPENEIARLYRDILGRANQEVAACVRKVYWTVAGIPVSVKGDR